MATIESIIAQLEHYREELSVKLNQVDAMLAAARQQAKASPGSAGNISCELCGKTFQVAGALGSHKRIVHGLPGTSPGTITRRKKKEKLAEKQQETAPDTSGDRKETSEHS